MALKISSSSIIFLIIQILISITHQTQILNHQWEQKKESLIDNAAKSIIDYLLAESADLSKPVTEIYTQTPTTTPTTTTTSDVGGFFGELSPDESSGCKPMESCFISNSSESLERSTSSDEKPMTLKLDPFHALDPHLQLANQMKLSQLNSNNLETYRLMNTPEVRQQQPSAPNQMMPDNTKSEMLISFEQSHSSNNMNPIAALASSQVLKLCSCTCQTMTPGTVPPANPNPTQFPFPTQTSAQTVPPTTPPPSPEPTEPPTTVTTAPEPVTTTQQPETTPVTVTEIPVPPTTTTTTTTEPPPPTTEIPTTEEPATTMMPPSTHEPFTSTTQANSSSLPTPPNFFNYCNQVQWVKPNKTVYASARIVWDVDRASQNYFICNNLVNGELVPGKTHGFSCKLSSEGRALEMHNFNVLTKPENINLAWVQRNSDSFGKTNLPVVGGYSKNQDPYIVSRCLVRDENNDVLSLIGYVNNLGNGWFPFDDIQIECAQYDILACVN